MGAEVSGDGVSRAAALRKGGMPVAAVVIVAVVGAPGFWEFFLNDTDDTAEAKADVAYQLLRERLEVQDQRLDRLEATATALRDTVNALLFRQMAVGVSYARVPVGAALGGRAEAAAPEAEDLPQPVPVPPPAPPSGEDLPDTLDHLVARALQEE